MSDEDWDSGFGKSVAVYLNGQGIPDLDPRGQRVTDDSFVLCFNAHHEPIEFTLPPKEFGAAMAGGRSTPPTPPTRHGDAPLAAAATVPVRGACDGGAAGRSAKRRAVDRGKP